MPYYRTHLQDHHGIEQQTRRLASCFFRCRAGGLAKSNTCRSVTQYNQRYVIACIGRALFDVGFQPPGGR